MRHVVTVAIGVAVACVVRGLGVESFSENWWLLTIGLNVLMAAVRQA